MNLVRRHRMTKDGAKEWADERLPNCVSSAHLGQLMGN